MAFFLAVIVVLPLLLVSVNSWVTELDIDLVESLTEEENDERDGEDGDVFFAVNLPLDVALLKLEEDKQRLHRTSLIADQGDLEYKVHTPPPELF